MKKSHLLLLAGAGVAYWLYTTSQKSKAVNAAAVAAASAVKDTQTVAGALGAVMTGNPMLAELGSLGDGANGYRLRHW